MSEKFPSAVFPDLQDRVVIVTGAGQGIGRVFAKSFANAHAPSLCQRLPDDRLSRMMTL